MTVTPEHILAFEADHPRPSSDRDELIRRQLGITPIRYYVLLRRAANSREGIAAHPATARMVRDRLAAKERARAARAHVLPTVAHV